MYSAPEFDFALANDFDIPMSILIGDTNGNRTVNAADVAQTKGRLGQTVSATTLCSDVNANGSINAANTAIVTNRIPGEHTVVRPPGKKRLDPLWRGRSRSARLRSKRDTIRTRAQKHGRIASWGGHGAGGFRRPDFSRDLGT